MDARGSNSDSSLRASDADRDAVAEVVNNALAEGRLDAEEHSERIDAIYAAKTLAELTPLTADLPGGHAAAPVTPARPASSTGRVDRILAIFSGATRKGAWHPDPVMEVVTVLGGAELDFREAVLPCKEITLRATTVLGGIEITVPPEMRVIDNGVAILGGREMHGGADTGGADAPVLRLEGMCILGGVEVRRKPRKGDKAGRRALRRAAAAPVLEDVRDLGRGLRDELREQRREWRDQMRDDMRDARYDRHSRHHHHHHRDWRDED